MKRKDKYTVQHLLIQQMTLLHSIILPDKKTTLGTVLMNMTRNTQECKKTTAQSLMNPISSQVNNSRPRKRKRFSDVIQYSSNGLNKQPQPNNLPNLTNVSKQIAKQTHVILTVKEMKAAISYHLMHLKSSYFFRISSFAYFLESKF